ncbi:MAG TPA: GWxTD domain-containing protein [Granulicella sp.]
MNMLSVPTIHAIGWTLLHFCWQGALVAVLMFCILSLLHGRSSQARYIVACSALVLMTALPLITYVHLVMATRSYNGEFFGPALQMPSVSGGGGVSFSEPLLDRITYILDRSLPLLMFLWGTGVLFVFGRLGLGLVVAHRIKSTASFPLPEELHASFYRLARRLSITRPVQLINSAIVQVPTLIGWFRPVVLIPLGCLSGLSTAQIEAILAHELAHIRRHDYLVGVLQSIVEALLFYHPAVWWVSKTIRKERENCCDDIAVEIGGNALIYAKALSSLEEHRSTMPAFTLGVTGGNLTMRIKRLLGLQRSPAPTQPVAFGILTLVIAVAAVSVGTMVRAQSTITTQPALPHTQPAAASGTANNPAADSSLVSQSASLNPSTAPTLPRTQPSAASGSVNNLAVDTNSVTQPSSPNPSTAPALSSEYQNWLHEDVRWDITPAERAAFLSLGSDAERDYFIEQFWLRRDPAGAPAYTYRTEHYGRIAYANQHFAASIPGWETDRGRIYILYGRPFSIDSFPSGTSSSDEPRETWYYRSAPGLGENIELTFVDACKCGNYHLQPTF